MNSTSQTQIALTMESLSELRVKVAELRGWTPAKSTGIIFHGWRSPDGTQFCILGQLPNWPNDLNACAEFEKGLIANHELGARYRAKLAANSDGRNAMFLTVEAAMCHATAEQRCRAFVAVMEGKK